MASPTMNWKKGLLIAAVVSVSLVVFVLVGAGVTLLWAISAADELGEPTAESITRTVEIEGQAAGTAIPAGDSLRLTIELQDGEFTIRPGPPGSDITVEGDYAAPYYELVEEHETDQSGVRSTLISLRPAQSLLVRAVAQMRSRGGSGNDLAVTIPAGVPIELSLRLSAGESQIDLGGLTLTDLDAHLSMGEHRLDFSRPLAADLASVRVHGQMGDIELLNLGNARAREVESSSRMGSFAVDLAGDWSRDAVAELFFNHSMGDLRLTVPETVRIADDSDSSVRLGDSGDLGAIRDPARVVDPNGPVVRLHVSTTMGETRFRRY